LVNHSVHPRPYCFKKKPTPLFFFPRVLWGGGVPDSSGYLHAPHHPPIKLVFDSHDGGRKYILMKTFYQFRQLLAELSKRSHTPCLNYSNAVLFKLCSKEIWRLVGDCREIRKHIFLTINLQNIIVIIFYYSFLFAADSFSTYSTGFIFSFNYIKQYFSLTISTYSTVRVEGYNFS